ncbi:MAG: hypothetical protein K2W81_02680 [Sphingomonas sp.]|uniref:hypothetical protein n=1 Tax=Sphingomonas sp. TaxID=28214 RepID=UPI0025F09033|nr:hypothetical protein [Sphingomonas sp.]MBY0282854.1 hypothetical protein [Sphingomonas sp.]
MLALLLIAQALPAEPKPVAGPDRPPFPAPLIARKPCLPNESATEIVVCGSRNAEERYRLKPLSDRYEPKPVVAVTRLNATTTASVTAEQREVGPGGTTQAIMLNFKFAFGGPKKRAK